METLRHEMRDIFKRKRKATCDPEALSDRDEKKISKYKKRRKTSSG